MTQENTSNKAEHPLKIFLSYGHPESEICQAIMAALKERGHDVWMDTEQIEHGMDWRRKITAAIEERQGVVSCLSRHSVRDPGVCLDELSIAIGVKGGNIFTVLLEPEKQVEAPASVCHLQWLDMSDWETRWGKPGWEDWFRIKMQQLVEEVESPESVQFAGQIEELRKKLLVDYSTSKQRSLLKQLFVGREWLTDEIEAWLADENGSRLCVLYGDPGVGKSAFAAHYGHYNPHVAASLFLEFDQPHYTTMRSVTTTLAFLLACRIPDYRYSLCGILDGVNIGSLSDSELFNKLIVEATSQGHVIDGHRETLCIVIDGLDESAGTEQSVLAEVLNKYVPRLPRWLRVLVTSREVAAVQGPLAGAYHLTLHGRENKNLADVRAYFTEALAERFGNDPAWPKALDMLTERSDGIFLYAQLVANGLAEGKIGIGDTDAFPESLSAAFHRWFTWFFPDIGTYKRYYRLPLAMILAAGQLPEQELRRVLHWRAGEKDDFLQLISVLLIREEDDFRQPAVRFTHQYLLDWLKNAPMTDLYWVSEEDAVEVMAETFYDIFQDDPEELTAFEALHLVGYLQESGMKKQAREAEMNHDLLWKIIHAGNECNTWGRLGSALDCYVQAQAMANTMCRERNTLDDCRDLSVCDVGMADIRKVQGDLSGALELYEKSLAIFEQLVGERGTPNDHQGLSVSYNRVADIRKTQGDLPGALELYEKSLDIAEQLVWERGTPEDRQNLSVSYNNMAGIKAAQGDLSGALELYKKSLDIAEQLVRERGAPEDRRVLSVSYNNVANIKKAQGDLSGALELYEKSLAIREQLVRERGMLDDHQGLSVSYNNVANIKEAQGDLAGALEQYEKGLAIFEQLVRERGMPDDHQGLSVSYNNVANIKEAQGDLVGALELYKKGLAIQEQLVRERGTPDDRRNLSISYDRMAGIKEMQSNLPSALELYKKGLDIQEQLVRERGTPDDRRSLSVSYNNVAGIKEAQDDLPGALELYEKSLAIREQLVRERGTPEDHRDLSVGYNNVADIRKAQGNMVGALELYEKSLAIFEQLVRERGMPDDHQGLSASYDRVADIRKAQGDLAGALELYKKSLDIAEQLVRERGTPDDRRSLSISYSIIADIRRTQGNLLGALALYEKSLAIFEQLAEERGTPEDCRDLSINYENIAGIKEELDELSGALALYEKSMTIREQLVQEQRTLNDRRDLSINYEKVGDVKEAQGDLSGALELYEKSFAIREQLVRERDTPDNRYGLSISYTKVAGIKVTQGDLAGALEMYDKSLVIFEQLVSMRGTLDDRYYLSVSYNLSVNYNDIADIKERQNDLTGALELYEKSLAIREQLVQERGSFQDYDNLAISYFKIIYNFPDITSEKRWEYTENGLKIAKMLREKRSSKRYDNLVYFFSEELYRLFFSE